MDTLIYIGKINLAIAVFALAYRLLLHRDYHLTARRIYIFAAVIVAMAVNFIPSPLSPVEVLVSPESQAVEYVVNLDSPLVAPLGVVWLTGVALLALRFLFAIATVIKYRLRSESKIKFGISYYEIEGGAVPFTLFNWIFIPKGTELTEEILIHEYAHTTAFHWVDILLVEVVSILFWFNPSVWYLRMAVRENVECMADREVLSSGVDRKTYQYSLLAIHVGQPRNMVASFFNGSQIKSRIMMMNTTQKKRYSFLRYMALPVLAFAFSFTAARETVVVDPTPIYILDGAEVSKEDVAAILPEMIQQITVLKQDKAIEAYGDRAKNGVIEVKTNE